jgi:DNA-binding MarR family transcriptional regulator
MQAVSSYNYPEDAVTVSPETVGALGDQVIRLQRAFAAMRHQLVTSGSTSGDGVEWAAYGLLFQLVSDGPRRSSSLAEAACVDPSTVSRQVAQLVKAGLVERQPDPEDGRASLLVATERGRAAYAAKMVHRQRMFAHVLDGWSDDDVDALTALLARFNDSFVEQRTSLTDLTQHQTLKEHA